MSITIIFLLLIIPLAIHTANATTPQITFGSLGPGSGQLDLPRGIAVDDFGNIYVADNRNHRVEKFNSLGNFVLDFDKGGIPEGIAVDRSGNIDVVDRSNMTVKNFSPKGILLYSFGSAGSDQGQLGNAERVTIDSSGNIYVTDVNVIQKFNSKGKFISQFFANDTQNCCMNAMGIAIDSSDNIYVADMSYNRILKFNSAGSVVLSFNSMLSKQEAMSPQDVTVDKSGNIYVADTGNGRIVKFDSTGYPLSSIDISGVPVGMAIDKSNKIYTTDLGNNRVDVFSILQFANSSAGTVSTMPTQSEINLGQNPKALENAIKLATSSSQFQSLVEGYNYTFSSDFEGSGPLSTGGIGLTLHGFAFELYSGPIIPGTAIKVVEVLEDPTLTKILNVTSYPAVYNGPAIITTNSTTANAKNTVIFSPLKQFKSGVKINEIHCPVGLQLVVKSSDNSPACIKPEHVTRLIQNGWTLSNPFNRIADTDILSAKTYNLKQVHYYDSSNLIPKVSLYDYSYDGIDKDDGLVSVNNQTFYQTTLDNDIYKLKGMSMQFHNVTFSFPEGTLITPGGAFVNLDVKFKDGLEEIYGGTALVQNGTVTKISGISIPAQYGPHVATNSITILGNHTMPQAGITIYHDKIKLLVSYDNHSSLQTIRTVSLGECDVPYESRTGFVPILYMPLGSTGKVCVDYFNGNEPTMVTPSVFDAQNLSQNTNDILVSPLQANIVHGNSTVVYTITSGNKAGFYGLTIFCSGTPIAVGYDNQSRIVTGDFPWLDHTYYCMLRSYDYHIIGVGGGMGIKYVPP
ncbi:MAG: hypothetical protein KGH87_04650 [Thaumarchaeota archaeon]|nr:hypothetical protein [Nitrososphaerota archaeon]